MTLLLALTLTCACATTTRARPLPPAHPSIESLAFLSGTWRSEAGPVIDEVWTQPAGDSLFGVSRTFENGQLTGYEVMRLERREGRVVFVATPRGQGETAFPLVSLEGHTAIFENDAHDFPQRIVYRAEPGGALSARIEGPTANGTQQIEFRYVRAGP